MMWLAQWSLSYYNSKTETKLDIDFIRCDNSVENNQFQTAAKVHPHMQFKFEYTAPGTPQQNGYGKSHTMLNAAKFNWPLQPKLWAYSTSQATDLENIIVQPEHKATAYELFYDGNPAWMDSLHKFGEIAVVRDPVKIWSKLKNQGFSAIYIGSGNFQARNGHSLPKPSLGQEWDVIVSG
jgi:hypothetical protein